MGKLKKIWSDPVGSKLIAESLKWAWGIIVFPIVLAIYASVKSLISKDTFKQTLLNLWDSLSSFFIKSFQINFLVILLIIFGYVFLTFIFKRLATSSSTAKIKNFNSANIWGAIVKWEWVKNKGKLEVKYGEYELVCPQCSHNLEFDDINGQHHLRCKNLMCGFRSGVFHYKPPSNVVILADMNTYYFHTALTSVIDAELRKRKLK